MRLVLDPRMIADGIVIDGRRRRLLVLLALGRLNQELSGSDQKLLQAAHQQIAGSDVGGPVRAPDALGIFEWVGRLPPSPSDLYLVGSLPLFDQVEQRVEETLETVAAGFDEASGVRITRLASQIVDVPDAARETPLSCVVHTAVAAGVDVVILSDQLAPAGAAVLTAGGPVAQPRLCVSFNYFVAGVLEPAGFDVDAAMDDSLLPDACRLL
jgi:hypothetical protein